MLFFYNSSQSVSDENSGRKRVVLPDEYFPCVVALCWFLYSFCSVTLLLYCACCCVVHIDELPASGQGIGLSVRLLPFTKGIITLLI